MNDKLEWTKGSGLAQFKVLFRHLLVGTEEKREKSQDSLSLDRDSGCSKYVQANEGSETPKKCELQCYLTIYCRRTELDRLTDTE